MTIWFASTPSPIGELLLVGDAGGLSGIYLEGQPGAPMPGEGWAERPERFSPELAQLAEYFAGARTSFELELAPRGTPFQRAVWRELSRIPFGETRTYGEIARAVGRPGAARAVGAANGKNPISIVVPCHRVIGASGALTGYAGGEERKAWLLEWERRVASARLS